MAERLSLQHVSLELVCREQGQPFRWLSKGDKSRVRILKTLDGDRQLPYRSAEMYCGRVNNVVVFGKSYVTDKSGRGVFFNQSHRNYLPQEFADYYIKEILHETRRRPVVEQECCFFGGFSGDSRYFGHFIFEFLYRLVAFDMCGALHRLPVVVYEGISDSWLSFLELYGVPKERILKVPQMPAAQFSSVWIASCPNFLSAEHHYTFWDEGVRHLRDRLRAKADTGLPAGPKLVYLGRRDVRHRKTVNENDVWQFLQSRGFEYPDFMGKSAAEQIRLIGSAEVIACVGGSGTAVTPFAPDNCSIIEVLPPHLVGGLGSLGFAAVLGQSYTRLPAKIADDEVAPGIETDFEVEMESLRQYVDLALEKRSNFHSALAVRSGGSGGSS